MSYQPFANLNYDKCALEKKDQENKNHFEWIVDTSLSESKEACFNKLSPFSRNPSMSIPSSNTDIESDLRGQTRLLSRCPSQKFTPKIDIEQLKNQIITPDCDSKFLEPEYTRTKRPCNVLSGISINRFEFLCEDHQSLNKIHDNSFIGTNTRLQVKDSYAKLNNRKM